MAEVLAVLPDGHFKERPPGLGASLAYTLILLVRPDLFLTKTSVAVFETFSSVISCDIPLLRALLVPKRKNC